MARVHGDLFSSFARCSRRYSPKSACRQGLEAGGLAVAVIAYRMYLAIEESAFASTLQM
jgi:hypothetical protein